MVFLIERAPEGRRGLMGSLASIGAVTGLLLGSSVGDRKVRPKQQQCEGEPRDLLARLGNLAHAASRRRNGS